MSLVDHARALLDEAAHLHAHSDGPQLAAARELFGAATRILRQHGRERIVPVRSLLRRWDGLPVALNPMALLGVQDSETAHTQLYAWFLDPSGTHGLGDIVLRRLLARSSVPEIAALALRADPLEAVVYPECPLDVGYADTVVVTHRAVIAIENKVWDQEHMLTWRGHALPQTAAYLEQIQEPHCRSSLLRRLGPVAERLAGVAPVCGAFFIRPAGAETSRCNEAANFTWMHVEADLALAVERTQPSAECRQLVLAFRSNLVAYTGATVAPLEAIQHARRIVDADEVSALPPEQLYLGLAAIDLEQWEQ